MTWPIVTYALRSGNDGARSGIARQPDQVAGLPVDQLDPVLGLPARQCVVAHVEHRVLAFADAAGLAPGAGRTLVERRRVGVGGEALIFDLVELAAETALGSLGHVSHSMSD